MQKRIKLAVVTASLLSLLPGLGYAGHIELSAKGAEPGSAVLELGADMLVTMTPIPFRLLIKDAEGQAVRGAQVSCEMTMPSMKMPENRPKVTEGDGFYGGELMFTCAQGAWKISCDVLHKGQPRKTLSFDVERVRMR